jgi:hypothetical protein
MNKKNIGTGATVITMTTIMIMTTIMTDTESLPEGWLFFRPASGVVKVRWCGDFRNYAAVD